MSNGNVNHPKKGSQIAVEPIKAMKDIKAIKKLLSDKPRDLCLFTLGINTNLRAIDLLNIKVGLVASLEPGDEFTLKERKTCKARRITINRAVHETIQGLFKVTAYESGDYLFRSQRGAVLTVPSLSRLVKMWCKMIHLKGNYASHTLRKTWGYHQRVSFNVGIPELMVCFNHSSQRQTLDYLCIQPEEIKNVYLNEL
ncbi:MAG: tyrosine-type recombinase/integrase [Desulfobacterium sp.]|nr:tyrosine-type recombinase/integrase [Desulfobacterium sp.]